jgi:hypothetical protein
MDRDLVLLTISFDPQYDTPERLTRYATSQRAGGPGWHFLTGDPAKIERVCNAFGIQYWAEEGLITHSLQTAVIDRDGRLAATVEGKDFTPQQLGDLVGAVLETPFQTPLQSAPRSCKRRCRAVEIRHANAIAYVRRRSSTRAADLDSFCASQGLPK